MKNALLLLTIVLFCFLHQDWWNWSSVYPLAFGFLPVGLWYHALYTLATVLLMVVLVRYFWPVDLEKEE